MISKQIIVYGHVQGVGFRNYTKRIALEAGIIGWVRNLFSGQVEILARHDSQTVMEQFIKKIWLGPSRSKVDSLEIFDIYSVVIQSSTFEITLDGESKSEF